MGLAPAGFVEVAGVSLAYQWFGRGSRSDDPAVGKHADTNPAGNAGSSPVTVVMLHEGLGSIGQWRDLPERIATRSGLDVIAYERSGHGRSDPVPVDYSVDYMNHEALEVLPELLTQLDVQETVLVGHSDGATIALIAASTNTTATNTGSPTPSNMIAASSAAVPTRGVVAMAPHTFVEQVSLDSIADIKERRSQLIEGLSKHHDHPDLMLDRWRSAWLSDEFRSWSIVDLLTGIDCPVLVLQGEDDEYGTAEQVSTITDAVPNSSGHLLADCGHSPHRDQPDEIVDRICDFLARVC